MGTDYYKLLGIDKSAGEDEVKKAYKKMVRSLIFLPLYLSLTSAYPGFEMASRS